MNCEICGREVKGSPVSVKIEGSLMRTCRACAKHGEVLPTPRPARVPVPRQASSPKPPKKEKVFDTVDGYALLIRQNRERMSLTQDQLGAKIFEKGSVISRIESGHMEPDIKMARKLERFFSITLLEELEE